VLFLGLKIAQAIMTFANSNNISISNTTIRVVIVVSVFIRGHPLKSHTMCAPGVSNSILSISEGRFIPCDINNYNKHFNTGMR
jgi:hypothetical protein